MKRALIVTVGTGTRPGTNIVRPLVKMIRHSNPNFLALVVSPVSRAFAETAVQELALSADQFQIVQLTSPDDIQCVFLEANGIIRQLRNRGFEPEDIDIDFTSGTKAMTGGAVLSGVFHHCGSLKYITGERKNGVVLDGTEKFLSISPESVFALQEINLARRFILELRFEPAIRILESINIHLLDEYQRTPLSHLQNAARAYSCWEAFEHKKFSGYYHKVDFSFLELASFKVEENIPARLLGICKTLDSGKITEDVLADIFNNARRRFDEGKYDDALSRLYRLTEMLAQWELSKEPFRINTGDVDVNRVPSDKKTYYAGLREKDGRVRLGLKKSYELLDQLGSPLGAHFLKNDKLQGLLNSRNNSILAHGTRPITREECRSLFECVDSLISTGIANFHDLTGMLDFPWRVHKRN